MLFRNRLLALTLRLSCGDTAAGYKLDLLSEEDIAKLVSGESFQRKGRHKFAAEDSAQLHQAAGRFAEQRRKSDAAPSMVVTKDEYEENGILYLSEFPTRKLNWVDNPNKITLVNTMPQIRGAFKNALSVSAQSPVAKEAVRLAVEAEVSALYQENGESEEERASQLTARAGLYLVREMAWKLK